jgi:hypothetical protein
MSAARSCGACGARAGTRHWEGCEIARCIVCGERDCEPAEEHGLTGAETPPMQTWTGLHPDEQELYEWGWYGRWTVAGPYSPGRPDTGEFVPCDVHDRHAQPDYKRFRAAKAGGEIVWSRERERYVPAPGSELSARMAKGTMLDGLHDHVGYAARQLPTGGLSAWRTPETSEFTAYVAACWCAIGEESERDWRGTTRHPPTEAGHDAALEEWERVHAQPLLGPRRVAAEAARVADAARAAEAARLDDALRAAGLIDPSTGGPNVEAIVGTWWRLDGPDSADSVATAARAMDQLTHYLQRVTGSDGPLIPIQGVHRLIGELHSVVNGLEQVFGHVSSEAGQFAYHPELVDDRPDRDPGHTARDVEGALAIARLALGRALTALGEAHDAAGHLSRDRGLDTA